MGLANVSARIPARPAHRSSNAASLRATVGVLGITALLTGVTLVVLVATSRATFLVPPDRAGFPRWMVGPLDGVLRSFDPTRAQLKVEFTAVMGGLFLAYLLVLIGAPALRIRWIAVAVIALHLVLALSPPLSLTDVFNYLNYGRMGALHHLNPYTVLPASEPHSDPAFALSNWHHLRSPYGPLFTLLTYALAPLGVPTGFWTLKLLVLAASLGTVWIVYRAALHLGRPPALPVAIVGLNPLILVWGLGGQHNDSLMMFALTGAVLLVMIGREALGGAAAVDRGDDQGAGGRDGAGVARGRRAPRARVSRRRGRRGGVGGRKLRGLRTAPARPCRPEQGGRGGLAAQPARVRAGLRRRHGHDAARPWRPGWPPS